MCYHFPGPTPGTDRARVGATCAGLDAGRKSQTKDLRPNLPLIIHY
jgi:hypothetical protein